MPFLRSFIFWIFVYLAVIVLILIYFPLSLIVKRKTFADECAKIWSQSVIFLLRLIHGINYKIIDADNIPKKPCIIACQHQSMWETIIFHLICKYPSYIFKKELLKVPFYGWYINKMSGIKVDRQGGASALKDMIKQVKARLNEGHNVVIFPQGTRIPAGADVITYPYQIGIAALYLAANVPVVPAALNSGRFWGKGFLIKKPGTITLKFLNAIEPGLSKKEFMEELEKNIEAQKL